MKPGSRPTDLFTRRSLTIYAICLVVAAIIAVLVLAAGADPRFALAAFAAGALVGLLALRPRA